MIKRYNARGSVSESEGGNLVLCDDHLAKVQELEKEVAQDRATLIRQLQLAGEQIAALTAKIAHMQEHTWCAYCGLEIHIDDEAASKISKHIMGCQKHPIHVLLAANARQAEEIKRLAKLGNEPMLGNGTGNIIAIDALKEADNEIS
jgi:hypothetical protein